MLITTSLHFEDIVASPLVLAGISDEHSEAMKNVFRIRPTKTEGCKIAPTVRGKFIVLDQTV